MAVACHPLAQSLYMPCQPRILGDTRCVGIRETQSQYQVTGVHLRLSKWAAEPQEAMHSIQVRTCFECYKKALLSKTHEWPRNLLKSFLTCVTSLNLSWK